MNRCRPLIFIWGPQPFLVSAHLLIFLSEIVEVNFVHYNVIFERERESSDEIIRDYVSYDVMEADIRPSDDI